MVESQAEACATRDVKLETFKIARENDLTFVSGWAIFVVQSQFFTNIMDSLYRPPDHWRDLPHYTPNDAPYFITFNLYGSISDHVRKKVKLNQIPFNQYDRLLDSALDGRHWSKEAGVAKIVFEELLSLERQVQDLYTFTIMSNHVHRVMSLTKEQVLGEIMQRLKGRSARACNLVLDRSGTFWQHENYDRVLRRDEHWRVVRYVLNNPVKAGLVQKWQDWPWTYLSPKLYG